MRHVTRRDWENLPLSEEALEALTSFFVILLESDNKNDLEEARQTFKRIRRLDMLKWLKEQTPVQSRRYEEKEHGRDKECP